ncbi:glycosyltransferase family 1 protein [Acinetobacter lwoffii]|uniref:glycosyltransferase family 4 protein n=1 Tax=Acinetobacter lwoffii TaxID=28090 RepID=UPI002097DB59|nr:glycosyltransferase family 1 protein [Acinetobacter lwoffii]MCO8070334.1 glycosyltransferase family 1 protein [Acinetobacter lwoffii]
MQQISISELLEQRPVIHKIQFDLKEQRKQAIRDKIVLEDLTRSRLKIAIVTETWPPEINGVAHALLQLCKGLQKQGHKILLIRPEQRQACNDFQPHSECLVKAHCIPKYSNLQFGRPQFLKIHQAVETFIPDIIHIVTEGPLGLVAQQLAKFHKIPVSSGFHSSFQEFSRFFDLAFLLKPIQGYLKWFHNNTDLTCVPSRSTAQALNQFGVTSPLAVVGRGVDPDTFSPKWRSPDLRYAWGVSNETRVMLYVGRLSPEKEIDVLIKTYFVLRQVRQQDVRLVVVGDGPDRTRLQQLNQDGSIVFTGSLTGEKLSAAYASADVFCFASQVETFGNVVLEAMASGLPVIAYDYACANLHVQHGETGWLSGLGHQQGLIQQMLELPDLQRLQQMGAQARKKAEKVGWQYPVRQFEQALYLLVQHQEYRI